MSDTPRTDAAYALWYSGNLDWRTFARELERENAALRERLEIGCAFNKMLEGKNGR